MRRVKKDISLIRRFSLLCIAAMVFFGLTMGWLVVKSMEHNMLGRATHNIATGISFSVKEHFSPEMFSQPVAGRSEYEKFEQSAKHLLLAGNIRKLKFWGPDSTVIWSQDTSDIGKRYADNKSVARAFTGQVVAEISDDKRLLDKYGKAGHKTEPLLELYIPIRFGQGDEIAAVVEIYEDMAPLYVDIASHKRSVWFGLTIGFTLLYLLLYGIVLSASRHIDTQTREIEDLFIKVTGSMAEALDAKSSWTSGHSIRVGQFSEAVALWMGLNDDDIRNLRLAGMLHDIGKIGTYDYLLDKPAALTDEEFEVVKRHPEAGVKILQGIKQLRDILPMIKHHHERFDGKGYPRGLRGEEIPIGARILHVTDSFEAITDDRPYRPARHFRDAIEELKLNSGTQFDPKVVKAFFATLDEKY